MVLKLRLFSILLLLIGGLTHAEQINQGIKLFEFNVSNRAGSIVMSDSGEIFILIFQGFVSDRIEVYDPCGNFLRQFPVKMNTFTEFFPKMDLNEDNTLYIPTEDNNTVEVYAPSGKLLFEFPVAGRPLSVAINELGEVIVSSLTTDTISAYDSCGNYLRDIPTEIAQFNIATNTDGPIAYSSTNQITVVDSMGRVFYSITPGPLVLDMTFDDAGNLYVSFQNGNINIYDRCGNLLKVNGGESTSKVFKVTEDGILYLLQVAANKVIAFR